MIRRSLWIALLSTACFAAASPSAAVPSFTLEPNARVSDALPQSVTGDYATSLRLYFVRDFQVFSASGTDGLNWTVEPGVRISSETPGASILAISSVTSASVLPLNGGGFRMVMTIVNRSNNYRVISATSADGLAWGIESPAIFTILPATFAGSARLIEESDGTWRLFYTSPLTTGFSSSTFRIFASASSDQGDVWSAPTQIFANEAHDVAPSILTDGRIRLYYTAPLTGQTTSTQLLSAIETSAGSQLTFSRESGVRFSTTVASGGLSSPVAVRDSETFRWRLYFAFQSTATLATPTAVSARTEQPDPQSLTPGSIARTRAAAAFTIAGEVFSSTVTVKLVKAGEADIVGTAVTANDDQTITATFDTQNAALGQWDLVVTNGDGQTATLAGALTVDFEEGRVAALDNVFRPLRGQSVHFDVTVFNDGRLVSKLYTLEGRFIRTLFDADVPSGTSSVDWDGRTDEGNLAASGVYLVSFEGPRLDVRKKVVVIK